MKSKILGLIALATVFAILGVQAAELTYNKLTPQTSDTELVLAHKADVARNGSLYTNLTAVGTNSILWVIPAYTNFSTNVVGTVTNVSTNIVAAVTNLATVLRSVVVNQVGTNSQLVLLDGTTVIGTLNTTTLGAFPYNVLTTNGLVIRNTGTSGGVGNITLTFY